jgi:hypothetical protein
MFMMRSMDKAQTDPDPEAPAAPVEERAARHLRLLARMADIQMEVAEAARTEAVTTPQPGIDYCQRLAVIARSLRLTLLLEDKFSRPPVERPQKAAAEQAGASDRSRSRLRVTMAMGAAALDGAETAESAEAERRFGEMAERLERPELAELVETCPPPVAVARLCRMFRLPEETERWLELGDAGLADLATRRPGGAVAAQGTVVVLTKALDQARIRRRLRVTTALGAAIQAGTGDQEEHDRRFHEMAVQMDRPPVDDQPKRRSAARIKPPDTG